MELSGFSATRLTRGPGALAQQCVHFGMLLATLAFASWWTSHTILDTARTRRVTDAVLENADVRHFVAGKIASITAPAVGAAPLRAATATARSAHPAASAQDALGTKLDVVLDQPAIRAKLEAFVTDAHDELIGVSTKPAVLDQATVHTLVAAALPSLPPADLAKVHAVTFNPPRVGALATSRNALAGRFWLFLAGAAALLALVLATTRDRRATLKLVGRWLIGISLMHLLVLWIVPVLVVPRVTTSPWADLVAAVARALSAGIVTGLVVLAAAGVVFLFADRLVAAPAVAPAVAPVPAPEPRPES